MTMWWIGVKEGGKMTPFEATKVEAFSEEFEARFGIAFGEFRSKEQAEADMKNQAEYLVNEAEKERLKRKKATISTKKVAKSGKNVRKQGEKPLKTSKPAELSDIVESLQISSLVLQALEDLKLSIVRAIEVIKLLKDRMEEVDDKNRG